jgi:hypothetical protein
MGVLAAPAVVRWRMPIAAGLTVLGLLLTLYLATIAASDGFAYDAHAYWLADGYTRSADTPDAFVYSPPVLLLAQALHLIPWPVWLEVYELAIGAGIWLLAGPLALVLVWTPQVASELTLANIHIFLALVAVYGLRWPALWSFALLTKLTPGVGLLWFVARGDWGKLAIALGVTAAFVLPTVILRPDLWIGWVDMLAASSGSSGRIPLAVRLPVAAVLVIVAARKDWPWFVPVASMLALPILWDVHGLSMLLGVIPPVAHRLGLRYWPYPGRSVGVLNTPAPAEPPPSLAPQRRPTLSQGVDSTKLA